MVNKESYLSSQHPKSISYVVGYRRWLRLQSSWSTDSLAALSASGFLHPIAPCVGCHSFSRAVVSPSEVRLQSDRSPSQTSSWSGVSSGCSTYWCVKSLGTTMYWYNADSLDTCSSHKWCLLLWGCKSGDGDCKAEEGPLKNFKDLYFKKWGIPQPFSLDKTWYNWI